MKIEKLEEEAQEPPKDFLKEVVLESQVQEQMELHILEVLEEVQFVQEKKLKEKMQKKMVESEVKV